MSLTANDGTEVLAPLQSSRSARRRPSLSSSRSITTTLNNNNNSNNNDDISGSSTPNDRSDCSSPSEKKISLAELARTLLKNLDVKDRMYHFKTYKNCLVGQDAVTWMVTNKYAKNRKKAVYILNKLHRLGVIEHVTKDHIVKDEYLFYRINDAKIPSKPPAVAQEKAKGSKETMEETLSILTNELHVLHGNLAKWLTGKGGGGVGYLGIYIHTHTHIYIYIYIYIYIPTLTFGV
eukprot:jgi/Bigna1/38073/e_gw1.23.193.1